MLCLKYSDEKIAHNNSFIKGYAIFRFKSCSKRFFSTFRSCSAQIKNGSVNSARFSHKHCHVTVFRHGASEYRVSPAPVLPWHLTKSSRARLEIREHIACPRDAVDADDDQTAINALCHKRYNARHKAIPFVVSVQHHSFGYICIRYVLTLFIVMPQNARLVDVFI